MSRDALHRSFQNVSRDLEPQIAGSAAVGGNHAGYRKSAFGEHINMVAHAEHDPLERRAPDVANAMMQAETHESTFGIGIHERRLLSKNIGKEEQLRVALCGKPIKPSMRR